MTRGPQHMTTWTTSRGRSGYVVHAELGDYAISFVFADVHLKFGSDRVCRQLARIQRELNTVWYMKQGKQ